MVKAEDFRRLEAMKAREIFPMIIVLYGEKLANELAHELVYNKDKYRDRTVTWPTW